MNRRDSLSYVALLAGVVLLPAAATAAFLTGHAKWGMIALTGFVVCCAWFWQREGSRRLKRIKAGRPITAAPRLSGQLWPEMGVFAEEVAQLNAIYAHVEKANSNLHEINAATADSEAFEDRVDERKLFLISLITAFGSQTESGRDAGKQVLRSLYALSEKPVDLETVIALHAGSDLIVHLAHTLAAERGESFQTTWQREATTLSRIISDRKAP